jgi:hypothetical protein
MNDATQCPVCESTSLTNLHTSVLYDEDYREPEKKLRRSNNYHRNYVLFEHVLRRATPEFKIQFVVCETCGFIFFTPRPTASDLAIKYRLVTEAGDTHDREQIRRLVDQRPARACAIAELLTPHLRRKTGRVLDVGGADGHCLAYFVGEFDCQLLDFEERRLWNGVKKIGETFADLNEGDVFDLCITCHTLEHIPNVTGFVGEIHSHLVDGGALYVEVPLGCAGEIYEIGNFLTHVNFFSEGALGFLLEQGGLHVEYMNTKPTLGMNGYLAVVCAIARKDSSISPAGYYLQHGAALTRAQMKSDLSFQVAMANARLVLASPLKYTRAFGSRMLRRMRSGVPASGPNMHSR